MRRTFSNINNKSLYSVRNNGVSDVPLKEHDNLLNMSSDFEVVG